jgi:hypothetical protein
MRAHTGLSAFSTALSLVSVTALATGVGASCAASASGPQGAVAQNAATSSTTVTESIKTITEPAKTITHTVTSVKTVSAAAKTITHTVTQTVHVPSTAATTTTTTTSPVVGAAEAPHPSSGEESGGLPWWAWVLIGVGVVAAVGGAYYYGTRRSQREEAEGAGVKPGPDQPTQPQAPSGGPSGPPGVPPADRGEGLPPAPPDR